MQLMSNWHNINNLKLKKDGTWYRLFLYIIKLNHYMTKEDRNIRKEKYDKEYRLKNKEKFKKHY